jgi:membrane protein YqaA with SNARE-associated domain
MEPPSKEPVQPSVLIEQAVVVESPVARVRAIGRSVVRRALLRVHRWAAAGWATSAVAAWAFLQSSILPGPAETLLVPLGLAEPHRVWRFAGSAAVGSFAGALVSFAIGHFAFYSLGLPILGLLGFDGLDVERSRALFANHGLWLIALSTITPLSLKLTSMAAGAFGISAGRFAMLVFVGRVVRFFVVAAVVYYSGERLSRWLARRGMSLHES